MNDMDLLIRIPSLSLSLCNIHVECGYHELHFISSLPEAHLFTKDTIHYLVNVLNLAKSLWNLV